MKHALALLVVSLFAVSGASAQSTTIRGEAIPDAQAYGMFLAHFSNRLADPKLTDVQNARMFYTIGLSAKDEAALRDILKDHKARRDAQLVEFNKRAAEQYQRGESVPSFTQIHNSIISQTQARLVAALSTDGFKKLDAFVQHEKNRMIVPAIQ